MLMQIIHQNLSQTNLYAYVVKICNQIKIIITDYQLVVYLCEIFIVLCIA